MIKLFKCANGYLYERFHMRSAEISLLVTYYVSEERRRSNGKNSTSDI